MLDSPSIKTEGIVSNDRLKTALVFAYYWPPASGPGVQRWLKFVKYLPENGWKAIIVTPKDGSYPNTDISLINDVPESTTVVRTKTLEPFRIFNILTGKASRGKTTSVGMGDIKGSTSFIKKLSAYIRANYFVPDARKGWVPYALKAAEKIISEQQIDLIVTTGPPHSAHMIGLSLKEMHQIPWVADLRDPWTNIYYNKFLPRTSKTISKDLKLETNVLQTADAVTVVSNGLKSEYLDRSSSIKVIPNGYDIEDFEFLNKDINTNFFRLSYIGNLKVNQNCAPLWEVLSELCEADKEFKEKFKLSFTGNVHDEIIESFTNFGLTEVVEILPFVEHKEAVKRMINTEALLFLIPESPSNKQIITGKIFEYLASKTPMLSIGPVNGDASEIIKLCGRNSMIDYQDKDAIKLRINHLYDLWKSGTLSTIDVSDEHENFSRKNLTHELTKLFEEL